MIWPLPFLGGPAASVFARGTALLIIRDPDHVQRTPVGWLARQYGLTPAEQQLTEAIVNGVSLADAAEQLGVLLSTVRTRLFRARSLLRDLFRSEADLLPDLEKRVLRVGVHPMSNPRSNRAIAHLLDHQSDV